MLKSVLLLRYISKKHLVTRYYKIRGPPVNRDYVHINEQPPRPADEAAVRSDANGRDRRWSAAMCAAMVRRRCGTAAVRAAACAIWWVAAVVHAWDRGWRRAVV